MKQRVDFSTYSFVGTIITLGVLACVFFMPIEEVHDVKWWYIGWGSAVTILLTCSLCYCPLSVEVTDDAVVVNRALSFAKRLPLKSIRSVRVCPPTMGAKRICGSGGFLGYWGWFRERDLGKYFAYHGKASDCFLVTMKNGRKYMLGCRNSREMVDYINSRISTMQ
ncbi:MAG: hypothetical protein IKZ14_04660 [Muribaculaceae bacterium]|nr:hypothetical protein [Muribaculaceae bacterium]